MEDIFGFDGYYVGGGNLLHPAGPPSPHPENDERVQFFHACGDRVLRGVFLWVDITGLAQAGVVGFLAVVSFCVGLYHILDFWPG
jgi:hypothetical protein